MSHHDEAKADCRKINRIIFESLSKFDGKNEVPLSLSSVKQIAGRAGRFGQTRSNTATTAEDNSDNAITDEIASAGGVVTTLHAADLPLLRAMLPLSLPPLTRATIDFPPAAINDLAPLLPASTTYADLLENFGALVKLPPNTVLSDISRFYTQADAVESFRDVLTIDEVEILTLAPFNRRDPKVAAIFGNMVRSFATDFHVSIDDVLEESRLLRTLKTVEETLAALPPLPPTLGIYRQYLAPPITIAAIPLLESLHKALVVYIWLSFRLELGFPDRQLASEYKARTEKVLDICLERMPGLRQRTRSERTKEMDNVHALYRRKYVDKHGLVKPSIEWVDHAMAQQDKRGDKWRHLAQIWNERPPKH